MKKGIVIGEVISTRKVAALKGDKLKIIKIIGEGENATGEVVVAKDNLDCDYNNLVIVSFGSGARIAMKPECASCHIVEAAISAILE